MNFNSNFTKLSEYKLQGYNRYIKGGEKANEVTETESKEASKTTPAKPQVSTQEIFKYLENGAIMLVSSTDKAQLLQSRTDFQNNYNQTHMQKEDILAMGFTEDEFNKYFYSTQAKVLNNDGEYVLPEGAIDTFALKKGVQINGRSVNSLDDLKYELFEAPITQLMNKVRAGSVTQGQIIEELQKLGATNIEEQAIENDPLGRTTITYTYRGKTDSFIPQNWSVVEEPKVEYDEFGEAFTVVKDDTDYSFEDLRSFGFTDSDLTQYFDKNNGDTTGTPATKRYRGTNKDYYQLKDGIVINGYEVKTVHDLYYFAVLAKLK